MKNKGETFCTNTVIDGRPTAEVTCNFLFRLCYIQALVNKYQFASSTVHGHEVLFAQRYYSIVLAKRIKLFILMVILNVDQEQINLYVSRDALLAQPCIFLALYMYSYQTHHQTNSRKIHFFSMQCLLFISFKLQSFFGRQLSYQGT